MALAVALTLSGGFGTSAAGTGCMVAGAQTIDGTDRALAVSQVQTVIPDYNFASAVYDSLVRENHFGDGTQSVKEVLATLDGYIEAVGSRAIYRTAR